MYIYWWLQVMSISIIHWILSLMFWSHCILPFNHPVLWKVWGTQRKLFKSSILYIMQHIMLCIDNFLVQQVSWRWSTIWSAYGFVAISAREPSFFEWGGILWLNHIICNGCTSLHFIIHSSSRFLTQTNWFCHWNVCPISCTNLHDQLIPWYYYNNIYIY